MKTLPDCIAKGKVQDANRKMKSRGTEGRRPSPFDSRGKFRDQSEAGRTDAIASGSVAIFTAVPGVFHFVLTIAMAAMAGG